MKGTHVYIFRVGETHRRLISTPHFLGLVVPDYARLSHQSCQAPRSPCSIEEIYVNNCCNAFQVFEDELQENIDKTP